VVKRNGPSALGGTEAGESNKERRYASDAFGEPVMLVHVSEKRPRVKEGQFDGDEILLATA
jgi:hypothetical protein